MVKFEKGRTYRVNGSEHTLVTVIKRTPCYVTIAGKYSGKYRIYTYGDKGLFGLGENILVGSGQFKFFCFASSSVEG